MSKLSEVKYKDLTANEKAILNGVINKCKKLDSMEHNLLVRINELQLEQIKLKNRPDSARGSFSEYYYTHNEGVLYGLEYALKILRTN